MPEYFTCWSFVVVGTSDMLNVTKSMSLIRQVIFIATSLIRWHELHEKFIFDQTCCFTIWQIEPKYITKTIYHYKLFYLAFFILKNPFTLINSGCRFSRERERERERRGEAYYIFHFSQA